MDHDSPRALVDHLDRECARLIVALNQLVSSVAPDLLYHRPPHVSIGENVLRSAAVLEQTFGGLTANLWDDPFEWTLPESLSTVELVNEYVVVNAKVWIIEVLVFAANLNRATVRQKG